MQYKPNQRTFYCPMCEKKMKYKEVETFGSTVYEISCQSSEEDCDYAGINWDIKRLESFEVNKIARVEELLDV